MIMNNMHEVHCLATLESLVEHPNMEIIQMAERMTFETLPQEENEKNRLDKAGIIKGIQVRLQSNESLKKIELRFMTLDIDTI